MAAKLTIFVMLTSLVIIVIASIKEDQSEIGLIVDHKKDKLRDNAVEQNKQDTKEDG